MRVVCVIGATGNIGRAIVQTIQMKDAAIKIRCCVHSATKPHGFTVSSTLEVVNFAFDKPDLVKAALTGCESVFLNTAGFEDFTIPAKIVVEACKKLNIRMIVKLSAMGADFPSMGGMPNPHGLADKVVKESGLEWCIVRPTFFDSNFFMQMDSIKSMGKFFGASGSGKIAYIDPEDIGEVAAAAMINPAKHNQKIYDLTGPEALSDVEVATLMTEVIGKKIEYVNVTPEGLEKSMMAKGVPEMFAKFLVFLEGVKSSGHAALVTTHVSDVIVRPAHSLRLYLVRNKAAFL